MLRSLIWSYQIRIHILVTPSRYGKHHHIIGLEMEFGQCSQRMGTFQCRDDAFQAGQLIGGTERFVIVDGKYLRPFLPGQVNPIRQK